jgi:hypothetical protein
MGEMIAELEATQLMMPNSSNRASDWGRLSRQ